MNFSSMDYFITVARERSFTRAAERLHITQQTLSAHIAGIEQELGAKLLVRHIPLELTYAGQVFLEYALDMQRRLNSMEREFQDITKNQRGLLRIGISYTRGHAIMPPLLARFQAQYPQISVRLVEGTNDKLISLLERGELDLAAAIFPAAVSGLELVDFYQEEMVLLVPKTILDPLAAGWPPGVYAQIERGDLTPLRDCPFLLSSTEDIAGKVGYRFLRQSGILATPRAESYNIETLLSLCARGVGACFCPKNLIQTALSPEQQAQVRMLRLGKDACYKIYMGYLKQPHLWSVLLDFVRLAQEMSGDF